MRDNVLMSTMNTVKVTDRYNATSKTRRKWRRISVENRFHRSLALSYGPTALLPVTPLHVTYSTLRPRKSHSANRTRVRSDRESLEATYA